MLGDEAGDGMWIDEVRSLVIVPFWREAACNMHETGDSICGSVRRGAWGAMWALCPLTHVLHSLAAPTITVPTHQVRSLGHDVGKARRGAAGGRGARGGGTRGLLGARLARSGANGV